MRTIFISENEEQENLASIIRSDKDKAKRKKALEKLRFLTGRNESVSSLQVIEYYDQIPNKPKGFKRFRNASIVCFPKNSNIGYNYK